MKCKKHPLDHSSAVGVCATCLRERLLSIIAAQEKAQAQARTQDDGDPARKPEKPPQLLFPRSVSPYLSHRKSDTASATATTTATYHHRSRYHIRSYHSLPDPKFFSTPQIGPNGSIMVDEKKKKKFGLFSKLFRSKTDKLESVDVVDSVPKLFQSRISDPSNKVLEPRDSRSMSSASPAWFPNFLSRKKPTRTFSVEDESAIRRLRRDHRNRGMSPNLHSDDENDNDVDPEQCYPQPSGYDSDEWRQTPRRTPATVGRRGGGGQRSTQLARNVSGISFCLSPMVRASPSQSWSYKGGAPPEMVVSGEIRVGKKSFCKNRSRKLADIGRSSHNR